MPLKIASKTATIIYAKNQPIEILNSPIVLGSSGLTSISGLSYYKVPSNMTINKVEIQIFEKGSANGILELDVLKTTDLSQLPTSIMTTKPSLDMAVDADYSLSSGLINPSLALVLEGDYIRIDLTSIPTGLQNIHIKIYATN